MIYQTMLQTFAVASMTLVLGSTTSRGAETIEVTPLLQSLCAVGPQGQGHRQAIAAWQQLSRADVSQLAEILAGMDGDRPLANNWIRAAAETIADRALQGGQQLPLDQLRLFLGDTDHAPQARRLAYEWIIQADPQARQRLAGSMLDDPSLELRRDAVGMKIEQAAAFMAGGNPTAARDAYGRALTAARDLDQIQLAAKQLRAMGEDVNLPRHFGFLTGWHLVGPFDNADKTGFDRVFGPEKRVDLDLVCAGKSGEVRWFAHATDDDLGMVDLNQAIGKNMSATAYAFAEFRCDEPLAAEIRLGCINANKVWLNGQLILANEVYHSGTKIDQYRVPVQLKPGRNVVLVKVCQNNQTESWAQRWQFQLRVCDRLGTAVLPAATPAEARK